MRNAKCVMRNDLTMKKFFGYVQTLRNYFRTPKGRHDIKDYARATCIIFLTALIIFIIGKAGNEIVFPSP